MICLYHGDYGPPDPAFSATGSRWSLDAGPLGGARNPVEAAAVARHTARGDTVAWCDQGYSWAEQPAVHWLLIGALLFVVVPYAAVRFAKVAGWPGPLKGLRSTLLRS